MPTINNTYIPYTSKPIPKKENSVVATYTIAIDDAIVYTNLVSALIIQ